MLGLLPLVDATTGSLFLYFNAPSAYLEALRLEPSRRTRWGGHTGRVGDRALERFTWSSREMERGGHAGFFLVLGSGARAGLGWA